ncbi:hypothetical protein AVEN_6485-1 [Araneus ventricosus]|uniref:Uncharacterized protein n=1 Tax=Araneus ventricosus TaxID=182803 RepID=A0A4Y2HA81_ARAVE|nr:hypothetical protein AVEN_6485-1 [Araneus ventricosus]
MVSGVIWRCLLKKNSEEVVSGVIWRCLVVIGKRNQCRFNYPISWNEGVLDFGTLAEAEGKFNHLLKRMVVLLDGEFLLIDGENDSSGRR